MVLRVPLSHLSEAMTQLGVQGPVFLTALGGKSLVSAAAPDRGILIQAESADSSDKVRAWLEEQGLKGLDGCWSADGVDSIVPASSFWISAIAYRSETEKPGLWVDASSHKPSAGEALAKMFEEFRASGEVDGMTLEEFIERTDPNVVILDPEEQAHFASETPCP